MENNLINIYNHPDITSISEFIKDKFYFAVIIPEIRKPKSLKDIYFFSIDDELIYNNFYNDFGPLNLGCLYKYCWKVNKIRNNIDNRHKQIVHYTRNDEEKKANAAYLISAYAILYLNKNPKDAHRLLNEGKNHSIKPFQDASLGISIYNIRLHNCLVALYKAHAVGFFNFYDFNLSEYEKYGQLQHGDLNWIVPEKFLAFIGPSSKPDDVYHPPEHYYDYFLKNNIVAIIRLNNKESYDADRFTKIGIRHYDMFMADGSTPSRKILNQFLYLAETINGPIAVHCRAGLGRTGTLIGAYLIKHYKMAAREAIAWLRICRPGSVIGHQQAWLEKMQIKLWNSGQQYRINNYGSNNILIRHKYGIYSDIRKLQMKNKIILSKDNLSTKLDRKYAGMISVYLNFINFIIDTLRKKKTKIE